MAGISLRSVATPLPAARSASAAGPDAGQSSEDGAPLATGDVATGVWTSPGCHNHRIATTAVSVQGCAHELVHWEDMAAAWEDPAFDSLLVPGHPGSSGAPFVMLTAAGVATARIRLGGFAVDAGPWRPVVLDNEVATLDALAGARASLGRRAGRTRAEWTESALPVLDPLARRR